MAYHKIECSFILTYMRTYLYYSLYTYHLPQNVIYMYLKKGSFIHILTTL